MNGSASKPTGVTLAQVASAAGVSVATASRVLNHSTKVNPDAYRRVCDAAARLGYRRHRAAWVRAPRRMRAVAALAHTGNRLFFAEPFFARFLGAVEGELGKAGIPVMIMNVTPAVTESVVRYLQGGHVDGILVMSDHGPLPLAASLSTLGVPITVIGRPLHPLGAPYVDVDNRGGAREAVEHLLAQGRKSIGHIAAPPDTGVGADRLAGYRDALRAVEAPDVPVAYGDWSRASAAHAMQRLLDQRPRLDAVFVASDVMAAGALAALRRAGRRVPDDVALVGFDDHVLAQQTRPLLTTVRQPIEELGVVAARRLLGEGPKCTVLPTELIVRESA